MPNWAEGTIKFRGNKDNIERFLSESIHAVSFLGDDVDEIKVSIDEFGEININKPDNNSYYSHFYIDGSTRAFFENEAFIDNYIVEFDETDKYIVEIPFKQAWDILSDEYKNISINYDLDVHIFAYERGLGFTREVEIINHKLTKDITNDYEYDDYQWNVPFTNIGG